MEYKETVNEIKIDLKCAERDFDVLMARHLKDIQDKKELTEESIEELFMTHDYIKNLKQRLVDAELEALEKEALYENRLQ